MAIYEQSLCSCGHPSWITYDESLDLAYRVKTKVCEACKAAENAAASGANDPPRPGAKSYVVHDFFNPNRVPSKRGRRKAQKTEGGGGG